MHFGWHFGNKLFLTNLFWIKRTPLSFATLVCTDDEQGRKDCRQHFKKVFHCVLSSENAPAPNSIIDLKWWFEKNVNERKLQENPRNCAQLITTVRILRFVSILWLMLRRRNGEFEIDMTFEHFICALHLFKSHLYSRLVELRRPRQLFAAVDVGIVAFGERCLQLRELLLKWKKRKMRESRVTSASKPNYIQLGANSIELRLVGWFESNRRNSSALRCEKVFLLKALIDETTV